MLMAGGESDAALNCECRTGEAAVGKIERKIIFLNLDKDFLVFFTSFHLSLLKFFPINFHQNQILPGLSPKLWLSFFSLRYICRPNVDGGDGGEGGRNGGGDIVFSH